MMYLLASCKVLCALHGLLVRLSCSDLCRRLMEVMRMRKRVVGGNVRCRQLHGTLSG